MLDGNSERVSGIGGTGEGGTGEGGNGESGTGESGTGESDTGESEVTMLLNGDTDSASILTGTALAHPGIGHPMIPVWP